MLKKIRIPPLDTSVIVEWEDAFGSDHRHQLEGFSECLSCTSPNRVRTHGVLVATAHKRLSIARDKIIDLDGDGERFTYRDVQVIPLAYVRALKVVEKARRKAR